METIEAGLGNNWKQGTKQVSPVSLRMNLVKAIHSVLNESHNQNISVIKMVKILIWIVQDAQIS